MNDVLWTMAPRQKDIDERIAALFDDDERMLEAIQRGIRQACKINRALGVPMIVWEDGAIKEIAPQDLPCS